MGTSDHAVTHCIIFPLCHRQRGYGTLSFLRGGHLEGISSMRTVVKAAGTTRIRSTRCGQSLTDGIFYKACGFSDIEFLLDGGPVVLHRGQADVQQVGNVFI